MHFKDLSAIVLVLCYLSQVQVVNSINYLGCYKFLSKPSGCLLKAKDENRKLANEITKSIAYGIEWLRQEQKHKLWFDLHTTSWVMTNMIVAGYINDNGVCTNTVANSVMKIQHALKRPSDITDGQLAMVMIGMKATCQRVTKFKHYNLIKLMKAKMGAFPKGDFNNYYQYSLGILALYLNRQDVPIEFGKTLLQHVMANKNKGIRRGACMRDTEALSIIALAAMTRQPGMPEEFLMQVNKIIKGAEVTIDNTMNKGHFENLITMSHVLQVLQLKKSGLQNKPYCKQILEWILSQQNDAGSFGGLMQTAGVLPVLSGFSILELRDMQCPIATDDAVDEMKILDFIKSRKRAPTQAPVISKEKIEATVGLGSDIEGVAVNARATVTLKKGATAIDALKEASKKDECFKFRAKETSWGPFIEMICHVEQNHAKKYYWMFYVNGKMAQVGAGSYVLNDHDDILFKYEAPNM